MPSFPNPFRRNESDGHPDLVIDQEDLVDDADSEWLAYELHEWASETRAMLAQLLIADQVPHSWQGTTLLAHESVEETVDALIEDDGHDPLLGPQGHRAASGVGPSIKNPSDHWE